MFSYFEKSKNHLVLCFTSQFRYRNGIQNFISNFVFQFMKKTKWHFRYTDFTGSLKKQQLTGFFKYFDRKLRNIFKESL